jgi:6-phosphogluconolactonase
MAQGHADPRWVFLGTDMGKGIYRARWDSAAGTIGTVELAAETDRPDFFALHPTLPVLYTVNAVAGEKAGVSGYRIDKTTGQLTLINRVSSHGDGPCAVSVNTPGSQVFVANYTGGTVAAYRADGHGALSDEYSFDCRNNPVCGSLGPVKDRQDTAHLHCVTFSPYQDHMLVCNLGEDAIELFEILGSTMWNRPLRVPARPGSGPRHVAFHPNRKWVYCIHELDCTVDLYDWDNNWAANGGRPAMKLRENSVVSTLTKGTPLKGNTGCEIFVSDDGRFLYTCSRGVDEILIFRIHPTTGLLTEHQRVSCGGKIPRYITLDPTRKFLVCCNQGAPGPNPVGNVTIFANDPATGTLSVKPQVFAAETPMFVAFV